jgi:hypothetical protein
MQPSDDGPPRVTNWLEELAAAWAIAGAIALAVFLAAPSGARPTPPPVSVHDAVAGIAADGFENAADRAATLAGSEGGPTVAALPDAPAESPAVIASDKNWSVRLCNGIAGAMANLGHRS